MPTFVSSAVTPGSSATSYVATAPASIAAGNLLIAYIAYTVGTTGPTITGPAGWTDRGNGDQAGSGKLWLFSKVATASEPSTYTFTTSAGAPTGAIIVQYSNAALDGSPIFSIGNSTTITAPSVTPAASGELWLSGHSSFSASFTDPAPPPITRGHGSPFGDFAVYEHTTTSGTPTGTYTITTGSSGWVTSSLLLATPATLVSSSAADAGAGFATSVSVPAPASIVAGNLLVAVLATSGATSGSLASTGWTKQGEGGGASTTGVFYKTATGSEPGSYTFTWSSSNEGCCVIFQYSGANGLDVASVYQTGSSTTTGTIPSITPSHIADVWIAAVANFANGNTISTPASFTARATSGTAGWQRIAGFDQPLSSSAATGTATTTFGGNENYVTVSILVAPSTATTGTATLTLGPLSLTATGTISGGTVTGTATLSLGPLTLTATGTVLPLLNATASLPLGPLTLTSASTSIAEAHLLLGPLILTATSTQLPAPHYVTTITTRDQ